MKKIWITSLIRDEKNIQDIMLRLKPYGIQVDGQFWVDDLENTAWANSYEQITAKEIGLWVIIADKDSLTKDSVVKGLSALALMVQAEKSLPVLILAAEAAVEPILLPPLFKNSQLLPLNAAGVPAKMAALLNIPQTAGKDSGYRLTFHPLRELGLWIELGPDKSAKWAGVMLGVTGCDINFQTYGDAGSMPEHSILEYPQQGLKLKLSDTEFTAWAIRNKLDNSKSYFARITSLPDQIIFGAYSNDDEADMFVIKFLNEIQK